MTPEQLALQIEDALAQGGQARLLRKLQRSRGLLIEEVFAPLLRQRNQAPASELSTVGYATPMYDSEERRYTTVYRVIALPSKEQSLQAGLKLNRGSSQAPKAVREELLRGLRWYEEGHGGRGLMPETVSWARRLARGEAITEDKAVKMRAWLARHEVDKQGRGFRRGERGYPSPGRVAWALWGGDPAIAWSRALVGRRRNRADVALLLPSNGPDFRPTPGYPPALQARDLSQPQERDKVQTIARGLKPMPMLVQHADPTRGAPVVWREPGTNRHYAVAGNSRSVALSIAPETRYAEYAQMASDLWPGAWPTTAPPPGHRWVLVREVFAEDGSPLSLKQAVLLAGASQTSAAGVETTLGRALSMARSLGLSSLDDLPAFRWRGAVHVDNVEAFTAQNPAFWEAVTGRLGAARRATITGNPEASAELVQQVLSLALPDVVRQQGFESQDEEEALLAALPALLTVHQAVELGTVRPEFDILPQLEDAVNAARIITQRRLTPTQALERWESEQKQTFSAALGGASTFQRINPLGLLFAIALKQAASLSNPQQKMAQYLAPWMEAAFDDLNANKAMGLLAGGFDARIPQRALAGGIRKSLATRLNRAEGLPILSDEAWTLLRALVGTPGAKARAQLIRVGSMGAPSYVQELLRPGYATMDVPQYNPLYQARTAMVGPTPKGRRLLMRKDQEERRRWEAAQSSFW